MMQCKIRFSGLFIICACLLNINAFAAVFQAASCSDSDIQKAIDSASDGDTVLVPAGTCSWTSTVSITKGITVSGAGIDETIIINNVPTAAATWGKSAVKMNVTGSTPWRFTGFTFTDTSTTNFDYLGVMNITGSVSGWRVDHIKFDNVNYRAGQVRTNGCEGLIDHIQVIYDTPSTFTTSSGFYVTTLNPDEMWAQPTSLGGKDAVYIEDSEFYKGYSTPGTAVDGEWGARIVFRHNTTTNMGILVHGYEGNRSAMRFEAYENSITGTSDYSYEAITWRGGSGVSYNNVIKGNWWKVLQLKDYCVAEDECDPIACKHPDCDSYPCTDQIGRIYDETSSSQKLEPIPFWGNTYNGSTYNDPWVYDWASTCSDIDLDGPDIIQENRDYYVQQNSFDGSNGLGVGTSAKRPDTCTTGVYWWNTDTEKLDRCLSENTWRSGYFKPYSYPHPLTQQVSDDIAPPSSLEALTPGE